MLKTKEQVLDWLVHHIGVQVEMEGNEIDVTAPFNQLGLSSIDLVQLLGEFNNWYGEEFSPTTLFNFPTIESFSEYVTELRFQTTNTFDNHEQSVEPLSIVGMSCRFPGAESLEDYWQLLMDGQCAISKVPKERWEPSSEAPQFGGFLRDPYQFDHEHFGLSLAESKEMDPQQKMLLELSWHALEDAGYSPLDMKGKRVGVFIGISTSDFSLKRVQSSKKSALYTGTGFAHSIAANRISYFFDFKGPSFSVDTACSSSLVAMNSAAMAIHNNSCELAIVGGVNALLSPFISEAFNKAGMLSPDGRCKSFTADANGYVRSEGGGVIVLKRASEAKRDNDRIYSHYLGSAVNQDGRTNNITAPNGPAQESVIREAIERSNLTPNEIDFVETHGTGTPLGDPIEFEALKNVFKGVEQTVSLGAVKTNLGHLEAAAGIAGVIKGSLSLYKKRFPKNAYFTTLNEAISTENSALSISESATDWEYNPDQSRTLGISSFGFGGTNAHVILTEPELSSSLEKLSFDRPSQHTGVYLSAASEQALDQLFDQVKKDIERNSDQVNEIASALFYRRSELRWRGFGLFNTENKQWHFSKKDNGVNRKLKVGFVFSGQGTQYLGMGKELYFSNHIFRKSFNDCVELFDQHFEGSLVDIIFSEHESELIDQTQYAQPFIFSVGYSLFKLYESFGLSPSVVLGHSLGEIIAACASGFVNLENACQLVAVRARLMEQTDPGGMLQLYTSEEAVKEILREYSDLSIAAINDKDRIVVSGTVQSIEKLNESLATKKIKSVLLNVERGFHSSLMDSVLDEFKNTINGLQYLEAQTQLISCTNADFLSKDDMGADFWAQHMRSPTLFFSSVKKLKEFSLDCVIEVGAEPVLSGLLNSILGTDTLILSSLSKKKGDNESLETLVGKLFLNGRKLDQHPFLEEGGFYSLPYTPFSYDHAFEYEDKSDHKFSSITEIKEELKDLMVREVGIDRSLIKEDEDLINLGADSLTLLNLLEMINDIYRVNVPISRVMQDLGTLNQLAKYLFESIESTSPVVTTNVVKESKPAFRKNEEGSGLGVLGNFSNVYKKATAKAEEHLEQYAENIIRDFANKTKTSKFHNQKYREFLADNRVSAGFRPKLKEAIYPIVFKSANGQFFKDIDGNDFLDFTMGFGVNLFGHSPDFIQEKILKQASLGVVVGPQSALAGSVAKLFCELVRMDRVAFLNSGTEAVMTAIRLARAKTNRQKVVIFEGSYHGHADVVLGRRSLSGETVPVAPGVADGIIQDLIVLDYGASEALEYIRKNAHDIAAVLVEGVQSRFPEKQPKEFLQEIARLRDEFGFTYIFDEVINGFRVSLKGAQDYFEVEADLAVYGKIIGGGFPIGAVAGKKEYLDFIDGGHYSFGDSSYPANEMTFFAGTFCKHPMAMVACESVLIKLQGEGQELLTRLNEDTAKMCQRLNLFFKGHGINIEMVHFGSLFRFKFSGNLDLLFILLNLKGIYIWEGRNLFLSAAHDKKDIDRFVDIVEQSVKELCDNGYIQSEQKVVLEDKEEATSIVKMETLPATPAHKRFLKLVNHSEEGSLAATISLALSLKGPLDVDALKTSVIETAKRFQSLTVKFDLNAEQIIWGAPLESKFIQELDLSSLSDSKGKALDRFKSDSNKPFDIAKETLMRIKIVKVSDDETLLCLICHHLLMDGLSIAFFTDEIAKRYTMLTENKKLRIDPVMDFKGFMQRETPLQIEATEQKSYWQNIYASSYEKIWSEADKYDGFRIEKRLSSDEYKKIRMFGYKNKSSLLQTLLSILTIHLGRDYKRSDFCIGVPSAGHTSIKKPMLGNCVNIVPIRLESKENQDLSTLVPQVKELQLAAFRNAEYPYELLKEEIGSPVEICFNVEPINELPKFAKLESSLVSYPISASEFPISFNIMRIGTELIVEVDFQRFHFSEQEGQSFLNRYIQLVLSLC